MLITGSQIRAARGLLDWSADVLAAKCGVKKGQISAIENGRSAGSVEVLTAVDQAFMAAGIECTTDGGIRPKRSRIIVYHGEDGFKNFFDDIYETARAIEQIDFCVTNVQEDLFAKWLGPYDEFHMRRMTALKKNKIKVLLKKNDYNVSSSEYCEYRWVSQNEFSDVSLYLYGGKSAFIEFLESVVIVTVVDNTAVSAALHKMFDLAWASSSKEAT